MDMKLKAQNLSDRANPVWDVKVINGVVPILSGDEQDMQCATVATFLELGTVKQLPNVGVPWSDFLTNDMTFADLDMNIRQSIYDAGESQYYPEYSIENEKLYVTVGRNL